MDSARPSVSHGWEVRDRQVGVLATSPMALQQTLLFRQLSPHVTLLQHTGPALSEDEREQLEARGVEVVDGVVAQIETAADRLSGVRVADGSHVPLDALVVAPRFMARAELLAPLGLLPVEVLVGSHVIGTRIEADARGATAVPGVWVAGNVTDVQAQVVTAAAAGLAAGAALNGDLIAEETRDAVAGLRRERIHGEKAWDERYRSRPHTWSGDPNPVLVAEVADLPPGTALDAGSGEGADAIWLARRGWQVTGAELSTLVIERAAAKADRLGMPVSWQHLDRTRESAPGTYDLVTALYLHLPAPQRHTLWRHLAAAVAPGGTLLVVGHDLSDRDTTVGRPGLLEMGWTAAEVADSLGGGWSVLAADHHGTDVTVHDAVLRARRDPA